MPTIHCPEGHHFYVGQIPCPYLFRVIPDVKIEDLGNDIMKAMEMGDGEDPELHVLFLLKTRSISMYMCPECGRLFVENPPINFAKVYKRDSNENKVLPC